MDDAFASADHSFAAVPRITADSVTLTTVHAAAGIVLLAISIGIFEAEMSLMFFDKSIDVTAELLVTFAAALLAPLVGRLLGPARAVVATSTLLAAPVVVATLVRIDRVELVASLVGIIAGTWWLALFAARGRPGLDSRLGLALPIALALILVYRAGLATLPLDEISPPLTVILDALLVAMLFASVRLARGPTAGWTTTDPIGALRVFAIPFILALASDVGLNGAGIAGAAGLGIGAGGPATTEVGLLVAGIGSAVGLIAVIAPVPRGPIAAVALAVGAGLLWDHLGDASLLGGGLLAFGLVAAGAAVGTSTRRVSPVPLLIPIALGVGWVASTVAALLYYTSVGSVTTLALAIGVVCVASVAPPWRGVAMRLSLPPNMRLALAGLAAIAIALPAVSVVATPSPASAALSGSATSAATSARSVTLHLMAYNIHLGYSNGNVPSIPDIADVIGTASPDLAALEEVSRGTVISGSHDVLGQLAHQLGMSYAFGPMFGNVEGVAVLSRLPIENVQIVPLAQAAKPPDLHRVALIVRTAGITFVATHLGGADFVSEVHSILAAVQGISPVIVAGDLNSVPTTPQMELFAQAGFSDLGASANLPTIPADIPNVRIDYFWAKGTTLREFETLDTTASDHRPIVADVSVP